MAEVVDRSLKGLNLEIQMPKSERSAKPEA